MKISTIDFTDIKFVSWIVLKFIGVSSKLLWAFLKSLRQSLEIFTTSEIFRNSLKMFGNVHLAFRTKIFEKWSEIFGNHQKCCYQYVYIIKRTLHISSKIWILCSRGKSNTSLVHCAHLSYCSCHSNIKFISSRHHVISSIYIILTCFGACDGQIQFWHGLPQLYLGHPLHLNLNLSQLRKVCHR